MFFLCAGGIAAVIGQQVLVICRDLPTNLILAFADFRQEVDERLGEFAASLAEGESQRAGT